MKAWLLFLRGTSKTLVHYYYVIGCLLLRCKVRIGYKVVNGGEGLHSSTWVSTNSRCATSLRLSAVLMVTSTSWHHQIIGSLFLKGRWNFLWRVLLQSLFHNIGWSCKNLLGWVLWMRHTWLRTYSLFIKGFHL